MSLKRCVLAFGLVTAALFAVRGLANAASYTPVGATTPESQQAQVNLKKKKVRKKKS